MPGDEVEFVVNLSEASTLGSGFHWQFTDLGVRVEVDDGCRGQFLVTLDGPGDAWEEINITESLGDFNMIPRGDEIGFGVNIANSTSDVDLAIIGFSAVEDSSELKRKIQATDSKVMVPFLFEEFRNNGNGADWTDLEAFVVMLDMRGPVDITIESIGTITEAPAEPLPTIETGFETGDLGLDKL